MEPGTQAIIVSHIQAFPYIACLILSLLAGYVVPFPEEVLFLIIGYALALGFANFYLATAFCILGIIAGDNILFYIGRKGGKFVEKLMKNRISDKQTLKYHNLINKYSGKTIFTSRFIAGLRVFVPIIAGTLKIKWKTFFAYNSISAILNVSLLLFIGYYFENNISSVISRVEATRHILALVFLIGIGLITSVLISFNFFKKERNGN